MLTTDQYTVLAFLTVFKRSKSWLVSGYYRGRAMLPCTILSIYPYSGNIYVRVHNKRKHEIGPILIPKQHRRGRKRRWQSENIPDVRLSSGMQQVFWSSTGCSLSIERSPAFMEDKLMHKFRQYRRKILQYLRTLWYPQGGRDLVPIIWAYIPRRILYEEYIKRIAESYD
jgi:hypothetical protein